MPRKKKEIPKYTKWYTMEIAGVNYVILEGNGIVDVVEAKNVIPTFSTDDIYHLELTEGNNALDAWAMNEMDEFYHSVKAAIKELIHDEVYCRGKLNDEPLLRSNPEAFEALLKFLCKKYVKPLFKSIFKGEYYNANRDSDLPEPCRMRQLRKENLI